MILWKRQWISFILTIIFSITLIPVFSQEASAYAEGNRARIDVYTNANFIVKNAKGKTLKWNAKTARFSGTMKIHRIGGTEKNMIIEVKPSSSFTYIPGKKNTRVRFAVWCGTYISGYTYAFNAKSITYSNLKGKTKVTVRGKKALFQSSLLAQNNSEMHVTLIGSTKKAATLKDDFDGVMVSGVKGRYTLEVDDLQLNHDSIRKSIYDQQEKIAVYNISENKIQAKGAKELNPLAANSIVDSIMLCSIFFEES